MSNIYVVAIDGPAASGKSTVAKKLAERLEILYLSSGSVYRSITYACLQNNIPPKDNCVKRFLQNNNFKIIKGNVFLNNQDYTKYISLPETEKAVSEYSSLSSVRKYTVSMLRKAAEQESMVMDGRDIGTVVFPKAKYKFFLTASAEIRAERRYNEFKNKSDQSISFDEILSEIKTRDTKDKSRKLSPLKKANDAILVDNSKLNIEQTIQKIYNYIEI
jgi:cytidylate kinase